MSDNVRTSLDDAIAAARSGRRDDAARMLRQIVAEDPFAVDGWIWLGGISNDPYEQRSALEHAQTLAPHNQRAQQGLDWLRQTHPEVFETSPTAAATADQPVEQVADSSPVAVNPDAAMQTHQASIYEASTQAMPVTHRAQPAQQIDVPLFQTDRMPTRPADRSAPAIGGGQTDRMTVVPPPAAPAETVVERRSPFAQFSRWLILALYLLGFGATSTLAALSLWDGNGFVQVANGLLGQAPVPVQLAPAALSTTYWSTIGVLTAIAVFDLTLALGFGFRQRWAWWVNLLVATLALAGAIGLLIPDFTFPAALIGGFTADNVFVQTLGGLTIFTAMFWLLSLASRRAFYPRRVVQHDER